MKYKDPTYTSAWKHMILTKYICSSYHTKSEFWTIIPSLDPLGSASVQYTSGIQSFALFWSDIWYQNCSMATKFSYLFEICATPDITLQQVFNTQEDALVFRRSLYGVLYSEWIEMLEIINHLSFTHLEDKLSWRWDTQGKFTVKSLYQFLNYRGIKP